MSAEIKEEEEKELNWMKVKKAVEAIHTYETPCIMKLEVGSNPSCAVWIEKNEWVKEKGAMVVAPFDMSGRISGSGGNSYMVNTVFICAMNS